jgi:hypothetical protein
MMRIPVEQITKEQAIEAARDFLSAMDKFWTSPRGHAGLFDICFPEIDCQRIAKVLLVGIGELSK